MLVNTALAATVAIAGYPRRPPLGLDSDVKAKSVNACSQHGLRHARRLGRARMDP
jgi:hypothetical protein